MAWKKIGEGLYQDTTTGAIGVLRRNKGGGLFVADSGAYSVGKYKKEKEFGTEKYKSIKRAIGMQENRVENREKSVQELYGKKERMAKKYGELSEEYRLAKQNYDIELGNVDYEKNVLNKLKTEKIKQLQNAEIPNDLGVSVKENQLKSLKTAGNVTQNTANLENAYIEQKNIRTKLNKTGMDKASKSLINKDFNAELNYANVKQKYSAFYGNEATNEVTKEAQLSLDRKSLSKDGYKNKEAQDFHFAGEELYSDDPNRFGDKMRKYNEKMNPTKSTYETLKEHILSHYTKDYGYDAESPEKALIDQVNYMKYGNRTNEQIGKEIATGGGYLVYNQDMREFLDKAGISYKKDGEFDKYTEAIGVATGQIINEYNEKQSQLQLARVKQLASEIRETQRMHTSAKLEAMSLGKLRSLAGEYNIDTKGLNKDQLLARIKSIFK